MSVKNFKKRVYEIQNDPVNLKKWLVKKLRRISMYWPESNRALDDAKVSIEIGKWKNGNPKYGVFYRCKMCKSDKVYSRAEVQVDHINEVAGETGFTNWDDYITALFCNRDGFQILCKAHHKEKTDAYNKKLDKLRKSR
jgi:5-methylcytosine-specific restriction endonuclease McrA